MRNLRNRKHAKYKFEGARLSATAWDATDNSTVLAFGPEGKNATISLKRLYSDALTADEATTITSWDAPSPNPGLELDRILDLHCFPEAKIITLVLAGGDIVVVREEPQEGEDAIEIVGSVDAGIKAAAWSPDDGLLAIATAADTLLFMTRGFEGIANETLSADDVKVSNHVSVGWGKKETQFKGRGVAKTLRDPTVPEYIDEGTLSPFDEGEVSLSWRGDGQFVAVNSVLQSEPKRRIIRIYSREAVLESVSEAVNGLESSISWKPTGQTIAGVQRLQTKMAVVFFERNGLRHGEFDLRISGEEQRYNADSIRLRWNSDSTVLAVIMKGRIQLWTTNNYHWYLKQDILLGGSENIVSCIWHPEKPLWLNCAGDHDLRSLAYAFEVSRGSVLPPNDLGIVAVIDGSTLKITPLRIANVPPPVAFLETQLPSNALDIAITDDATQIAVLHASTISLWKCDFSGSSPKKPSQAAIVDVSTAIRNGIDHGIELQDQHRIRVPQADYLYIRTDHDRIYYSAPVQEGVDDHDTVSNSLPSTFDAEASIWRAGTGESVTFQLSTSGILSIGSASPPLRISGCTSYVVTETYLIYTTGQHLLKFVHLHAGELDIPLDSPELDERCRSIERGAKIVTVCPSICSVLLQMPRGNLETIYPRALVLAEVRRSLDAREYRKALLTCRTHRVDMNILHDYKPEQFTLDVERFVTQIKKTEHLDLFLSSLTEEDVSKTMYKNTLISTQEPMVNGMANGYTDQPTTPGRSKVNSICDAILRVLQKQSPVRLQNIVTAHVSKDPPDLNAGLQLVSGLRAAGDQSGLEEAIEHICFLADVNHLYDAALGLCDLDVALLVAQQSQKDPREYLPYLQGLYDMQPLRRQFNIDNDLKRYAKAATHLHAMGDFEEVKSYTVKHDLYAAATSLYRYDEKRLSELVRLHADYLSSRNRVSDAGIAYEYVGDHTAAMEAFRTASMWQECLTNAMLIPFSKDKLHSLAQDVASSLEEAKDFKSAAAVHADHLDDVETAARLLCKASDFSGAMRLVVFRQKPELLTRAVDAGLIEASATMLELTAEMKSQLNAQVPRLRELREKKAEDPMAFLDGADGGETDILDNISLAPTDASTSGGTFMTRYTNRSAGTLATNATRKTSKNRRREERKRARGKKGTVYEEEYLINSIARLMERLNDSNVDAAQLVQALMRRNMRERAIAVQDAVAEVTEACSICAPEVFPVKSESQIDMAQEHQENGSQTRPWGGQGVLWEAERFINSPRVEQPILKPMERLNLLT